MDSGESAGVVGEISNLDPDLHVFTRITEERKAARSLLTGQRNVDSSFNALFVTNPSLASEWRFGSKNYLHSALFL